VEVQELLLGINKELENLMLIVTHNRELADQADVALEMCKNGRLCAL